MIFQAEDDKRVIIYGRVRMIANAGKSGEKCVETTAALEARHPSPRGGFTGGLLPCKAGSTTRIRAMARKKKIWMPPIGCFATYIGRGGKLARGGYNVRVLAETCADRMVVEALGRSGKAVRFTVKRENLAPLQPGLFDSG